MSGQLLITDRAEPLSAHVRSVHVRDGGPTAVHRPADVRPWPSRRAARCCRRSRTSPRPAGGGLRPGRADPADPRPAHRHQRALLDQSLVSGIGNIYADEALASPAALGPDRDLTRGQIAALFAGVHEVFAEPHQWRHLVRQPT
jgi:formamidopyrimidine-DNA glycosylase